MIKNFIKDLFPRYPQFGRIAQKLYACVPSKLRISKTYLDWVAFFRLSEAWSKEEHQQHQLARINTICTQYGANNPKFLARFGRGGRVEWNNLDEFSRMMPTLSREAFQREMTNHYPADILTRKYVKGSTSGTTGQALHFYHERLDSHRENAAIRHQWSRVGYDPIHSRRVEFRGLTMSRKGVDYYPQNGVVRCNILDFSVEAVRRYSEVIFSENLVFFHGYPSALCLLATTIKRYGIRFPEPQAVLLASEIAYESQIELLQEVFPRSRIYAHYGCSERAVLAGWCEQRREYHVIPTYSYVELDQNTGEIIGTNLYNSVNPFLRYRMTDVASGFVNESCAECGRSYFPRIKTIEGRTEDFLFSVEHGWIPPAIVTYPFKTIQQIREIQILQNCRKSLKICYSVHHNSSDLDIQREISEIREKLGEIMGGATTIIFSQVDGFKRGPTGKFKWIVSTLDSPFGSMGL